MTHMKVLLSWGHQISRLAAEPEEEKQISGQLAAVFRKRQFTVPPKFTCRRQIMHVHVVVHGHDIDINIIQCMRWAIHVHAHAHSLRMRIHDQSNFHFHFHFQFLISCFSVPCSQFQYHPHVLTCYVVHSPGHCGQSSFLLLHVSSSCYSRVLSHPLLCLSHQMLLPAEIVETVTEP